MELKLARKKLFEGFEIECYKDTSTENGDFYMTRKQISDALDYKNDTQLNVTISRNKDIIKDPTYFEMKQVEGEREIEREMIFYKFKQLFQMLRFTKQPKANLFMEWASITLKELITGRAELKFSNAESKEKYEARIAELLIQVEELQDLANGYTKVMFAPNCQQMINISKVLDVGRNKLFAFLREIKVLRKDNTPYQKNVTAGHFMVKEATIPNGEMVPVTYVTGKGLNYIRKKLEKVNYQLS